MKGSYVEIKNCIKWRSLGIMYIPYAFKLKR